MLIFVKYSDRKRKTRFICKPGITFGNLKKKLLKMRKLEGAEEVYLTHIDGRSLHDSYILLQEDTILCEVRKMDIAEPDLSDSRGSTASISTCTTVETVESLEWCSCDALSVNDLMQATRKAYSSEVECSIACNNIGDPSTSSTTLSQDCLDSHFSVECLSKVIIPCATDDKNTFVLETMEEDNSGKRIESSSNSLKGSDSNSGYAVDFENSQIVSSLQRMEQSLLEMKAEVLMLRVDNKKLHEKIEKIELMGSKQTHNSHNPRYPMLVFTCVKGWLPYRRMFWGRGSMYRMRQDS